MNQCLSCHGIHYDEFGDCGACHGGIPRTKRRNIAHYRLIEGRYASFNLPHDSITAEGEQLLKANACRRCHVSAGKGNLLAATLDRSNQDKLPEELDSAIRVPVLFMPQFHFHEKQRVKLINAILAGARQAPVPAGETPLVIHFENVKLRQEFQFEKYCGLCHRSLTPLHGGLGSGIVGPNLSGLFSPYYPENSGPQQNQNWTPERLKDWLANPRKYRPDTQMAPVALTEKERARLIDELSDAESNQSEP